MPVLRRKISSLIILAILFVGGFLFYANIASAEQVAEVANPDSALNQGLVKIQAPLGLPATDIRVIVANIIRGALGLLGIIVLALMLYAGYIWMTAGGNEEKITEAKKILRNAVVGLLLIFSSYAIVSFVMTRFVGATTGIPDHCFDNINDSGEEQVGPPACGGDCGPCTTMPIPNDFHTFYVMSLPPAGDACIRNVHPTIVFNKDIDLTTINSGGVASSIIITKVAGGVVADGAWSYLDSSHHNIIKFDATGSCGTGTSDCFDASNDYILTWPGRASIQATDGMALMCYLRAGCSDVSFTTGANVDRTPPTVIINNPDGTPVSQNAHIPVNISYTDDNGVAIIALDVGGSTIVSESISGCQTNGTVDAIWSTYGVATGTYGLEALATDRASFTDTDTATVEVIPQHCFDTTLNYGETLAGPPACGGECRGCGGDSCDSNIDCASGYCDMTTLTCVDKMKILRVTPLDGAAGTFVSIAGQYFGNTPGSVYFSKVQNPTDVHDNTNQWVQAQLAPCTGASTWLPWQVIVTVPINATSGPIKVETASTTGRDNVVRTFLDTTHDIQTAGTLEWGPEIDDFLFNTTIHPGLCSVSSTFGGPGDQVRLSGKNFGNTISTNDSVKFGELRDSGTSQDRAALVTVSNWHNENIDNVNVPTLDMGWTGTAVFNQAIKSNVLAFEVSRSVDPDAPLITNISPDHGAHGEYITVSGRNFGTHRGEVFIRTAASESASVINAVGGGPDDVFVFPEECNNSVWRDSQVVMKFPRVAGTLGQWYSIRICNIDNDKCSVMDGNTGFTLEGGNPKPGICRIDPIAGPVPLVSTGTMSIVGEYFASTTPDITNYANAFYWLSSASSTSLEGRVPGIRPDADYRLRLENEGSHLDVRLPTNAIGGPVVVHRDGDTSTTFSNPMNYTKWNCVENGNQCADVGTYCCTSGGDAGECKPNGTLCAGATRSAGYTWMFSTKDIPEPPRLIERCDSETELGNNLPSPSPSTQWARPGYNETQNVCLTSLISLDFTGMAPITAIPAGSVLAHECDPATIDLRNNNCTAGVTVDLKAQDNSEGPFSLDASTASTKDVQLQPRATYNNGKWKENTWYQVILTKDLVGGPSSTMLAAERPCGADNPYCFLFKTGTENCRMKELVITPYSYWTTYLQDPLMQHDGGNEYDLFYSGHGLSDQRCIMMDVSGFRWNWTATDTEQYAYIKSNATSRNFVQISTIQNTVGIGLPNNATAIWGQAATGTCPLGADCREYNKASPLTIDASNPEVVDYGPNCLEACTDAVVWARWNVVLSERNLTNDSVVQLQECLDENCLQLSANLAGGATLDTRGTEMSLGLASRLQPNTVYQVSLSTSSDNNVSPDLIWSRQVLSSPSSAAHPYKKLFTWRFKTKNQDCLIDHTVVDPANYTERKIGGKKVYQTIAYSAPDACSVLGQKLNTWSVDWQWRSSDSDVASLTTVSTRGKNPFCTASCLKRGSEIPAGYAATNMALCGNGVVEAGEDCDLGAPGESANSCTLNCLRPGNTNSGTGTDQCGNGAVNTLAGEECDPPAGATAAEKAGCSNVCLRAGSRRNTGPTDVGASICGNGRIGLGEDCDTGISASSVISTSSLACSENCLHLGSRLSSAWCHAHNADYAGFVSSTFWVACKDSRSQCGDKVVSPDEDGSCDLAGTGWASSTCNIYCLINKPAAPDTDCYFVDINKPTEGCDKNLQWVGSSLLYSAPSVCGDGVTGIGEDSFCESPNNLVLTGHAGKIDPWAMVKAVGLSPYVVTGTPPTQLAFISASTSEGTFPGTTVGNKGKYQIPCGYFSDAECQAATQDNSYAVAANSCCYPRPQWIDSYPTSTAIGVCPNTYIEASFDRTIDQRSANDNFVIAEGITDPAFGTVASFEYGLPQPQSTYQSLAPVSTQMVVAGNYAYVIYEKQNLLEIVDISDRSNLRRVTTLKDGDDGARLERPIGIGVVGNYIYITSRNDNGIEVIDVSNPSQPRHKTFYNQVGASDQIIDPISSSFVHVGVNSYIYLLTKINVLSGTEALVACTIANNDPGQISCKKSTTDPQGLTYNLDKAIKLIAGQRDSTVVVFLVLESDSDKIQKIQMHGDRITAYSGVTYSSMQMTVSDVYITEYFTYFAGTTDAGRLKIRIARANGNFINFDARDTVGASFVWFQPIPGASGEDGFVLVGSAIGNVIEVYRFSNGALSHFGAITTAEDPNLLGPKTIVGAGDYILVGLNKASGIDVLSLDGFKGLPGIGSAAVFGDGLVLSSGLSSGSLQKLNLSNALSPVNAGDVSIGAIISKMIVNNGTIYGISNQNGGSLHIVDTGFSGQISTSTLSSGGTAFFDSPVALAAKGNYVYVLSQNVSGTLQIVDVSSTTAPVGVGRLEHNPAAGIFLQYAKDVAIQNNLAYVIRNDLYGKGSLRIFDISTSTSPTPMGSAGSANSGANGFRSLVVQDNVAYVAASIGNRLELYDVSSSTHPTYLGATASGVVRKPSALAVRGQYAYVGGQSSGNFPKLFVVDLTNTASPTVVASTSLSGGTGGEVSSVNIVGTHLYATVSGSDQVSIVDIGKFLLQGECYGANDVTSLITGAAGAVDYENLPWYEKIWNRLANFVRKIFVGNVTAAGNVRKWCVNNNLGSALVVPNNVGEGSRILYRLTDALSPDTKYAVVMKEKLRDLRGVNIGFATTTPTPRNFNFDFTTGVKICEVGAVTVTPTMWAFQRLTDSAVFQAEAFAQNGQQIQSVSNYFWNYIWGPEDNEYVTLRPGFYLSGGTEVASSTDFNIVRPKNKNGEIDIAATANIKRNDFTDTVGLVASGRAHILVFLCNNPWPPNKAGNLFRIPYCDTNTTNAACVNDDAFNLSTNLFSDSGFIPPASPYSASTSDHGYFNFSSLYCMDNAGASIGNLPFLRPAVQSTSTLFESDKGVCSFMGNYCDASLPAATNCKFRYDANGVTFYASSTQAICYGLKGTTTTYYMANNQPLYCNTTADCNANVDFTQWFQAGGYTNNAINCGLASSTPASCIVRPQPLKRFFFTNQKNNDAIGIQVFPNPKALSVEQWFSNDKTLGGQGFVGKNQSLTIDGYKATRDNNNIYVDVFNASSDADTSGASAKTFFSNIFLFSINADAKPETRQVFEQFVANLKFNTNLSNFGYCASSVELFEAGAICRTDFDCPNGTVCANQKTKFQRNYQRLRDLKDVSVVLDRYYTAYGRYPSMRDGSYLPGQAVSTWPAWAVFSNQVGYALNGDPINKMPTIGTCSGETARICTSDSSLNGGIICPSGQHCVIHDPNTGWSTADRRFSFACNSLSSVYRYMYTTSSVEIRARMEEPFAMQLNQYSSWDSFKGIYFGSDYDKFVIDNANGICNTTTELSTVTSGVCGDGQINVGKGEQCDPPGVKTYNTSPCASGGDVEFHTCQADCRWDAVVATTSCTKIVRTCGNGIKEPGEECDQGQFNGKYNHCNATCSGFGDVERCGDGSVDAANEVCDVIQPRASVYYDKFGVCSSGINKGEYCKIDADCQSMEVGACKLPSVVGVRYGKTKNESCNFDCQSRGPYCGDGIVQPEFGEECDGDQSCSTWDNQPGKHVCLPNCKQKVAVPANVAAWWKFDDALPLGDGTQEKFYNYTLNATGQVVPDTTGTIYAISTIDNNDVPVCYAEPCATHMTQKSPTFAPSLPVINPGYNGAGYGAENKSFYFNGTNFASTTFVLDQSGTPEPFHSVTYMAWVYPTSIDNARRQVLSADDGFYGWSLLSNNRRWSFFDNWRELQTTGETVDTNYWQHVAVVYDRTANKVRFYKNGGAQGPSYTSSSVFDIGYDHNSTSTFVAIGTNGSFWNRNCDINKTDCWRGEKMQGRFDEMMIFNRALSEAEINQYVRDGVWKCEPLVASTASTPDPKCGNGKVEADEACDVRLNGVNKNGIACVPAYGKTCSYCSADCKSRIDVQPKEYCGDGKLQADMEKCDGSAGFCFATVEMFGYAKIPQIQQCNSNCRISRVIAPNVYGIDFVGNNSAKIVADATDAGFNEMTVAGWFRFAPEAASGGLVLERRIGYKYFKLYLNTNRNNEFRFTVKTCDQSGNYQFCDTGKELAAVSFLSSFYPGNTIRPGEWNFLVAKLQADYHLNIARNASGTVENMGDYLLGSFLTETHEPATQIQSKTPLYLYSQNFQQNNITGAPRAGLVFDSGTFAEIGGQWITSGNVAPDKFKGQIRNLMVWNSWIPTTTLLDLYRANLADCGNPPRVMPPTPACEPDCSGNRCGDDGCGGVCPTVCDVADEQCGADGQCECRRETVLEVCAANNNPCNGITITDRCGKTLVVNSCPSPCIQSICGDGRVEGTEKCDDGAVVGGDGCDASCQIEFDYSCPPAGGACTNLCGNSIENVGERCDKGRSCSGNQAACRDIIAWFADNPEFLWDLQGGGKGWLCGAGQFDDCTRCSNTCLSEDAVCKRDGWGFVCNM